MISAIAPIYVKDEFIGVVGTDVTLDLLVENFINSSSSGLSYSMLLDDKLRPIALSQKATQDIYRTDNFLDDLLIQQSLLDYDSDFKSVLSEVVSLEQGFRKIKLADRNVYISFARVTELNWFYAEIIEESEIMKASKVLSTRIDSIVDNLVLKLGIPMLISFAFMTFILFILANKFVKPIILLSKFTQKISNDNLDQEILIRADGEVGQLISDFSLMQKSLSIQREKMESQLKFQRLLMNTVNTPIFIKNDKRYSDRL